MMIHAYSDLYLESTQNIIGHMFDFAVNENGILGDTFAEMFTRSQYAGQVEKGNPAFVAGKTGPELARLVLESEGYGKPIKDDVMYADRSPEYWVGWSVAYYQWLINKSFSYIFEAVKFSELIKMYPIYHEMDITQFVTEMDRRMAMYYQETSLEYER